MKFNGALFEDMSRLANGAASALSSIREQMPNGPFGAPFGRHFTARTEPASTISREEFDAVAAMAAKARAREEELMARIEALEAQVKTLHGAA